MRIFIIVSACIVVITAEHVFFRLAARERRRYLTFVVPGIGLYGVELALWYLLLRETELGVALPLMGLQYAAVALAGKMLFGEKVDLRRWIGIAVIVIGVVFIAARQS